MEYGQSQQQQQRPRSVATGVSRKSSMASRNSQLIKKNTVELYNAPRISKARLLIPLSVRLSVRPSNPLSARLPRRYEWHLYARTVSDSTRIWVDLLITTALLMRHFYELRPSDVLIERFNAWKRLVKNLIAYFEGIADIESNTAKELTKLGGVIQVPFREGNQFLGEGGVQDIFYGVREKTRAIADSHANLAKTVEGSIVQHLQKLRTELKAHVKNIQQDTGKLAAAVAKERELSTKMITDLARSITMLKNTPMGVHAKEDPWYTNSLVARQLQKQVHEENALQKSIIIMQQNSEHFEEGVVRAIQMAWQTFDEWNARASAQVQETWASMGQLMRSVAPTTEWIAFASRSEYLLDPDTPLRNPLTINYPGKDDPSVIPVHQGILERKKRYTKTYKESFYILTPAGYLHEHASSDLEKHPNPELSLFLPECTLGAPTSPNARSHKFHIEGKKALGGDVGQKNGLFAMDASFTFRARSHDEVLEWWNDCKQLSKVYLTSSEPFDRSGPVPAAVRSAGYCEEESEEESEEGSSVEEESEEEEEEEEDEDEDEEEHEHAATGHGQSTAEAGAPRLAAPVSDAQEVPSYSAPAADSGIETNASGYAVEKKNAAGASDGQGQTSGSKPDSEHAAEGQKSAFAEQI
ncbi:BQ2448_7440 [Microbotryum intermedium]|uniref:BQ2448_7440 protein n=1 Tax=Microbotryum intermedium TaxID=269621 RepID=A0A238FNR1_9BASI|nr:BQ2448_7440 [Microbotryum intermedium]